MVKRDPNSKRIQQLAIPKEVFNQYYELAKYYLPPSFYAKPNAKFSTKTIVQYVTMMCAKNTSHNGISEYMRDETDKDIPTGACLLKRVGGSPYMVTRNACDKMLNLTLSLPQIIRILKKPTISATDEHDVPVLFLYFIDEYMATGKPKGGSSKHLRYTTFKIVCGSLRLTVAVHATGQKYKKADIVRLQLEYARKFGIRSKVHLLDKGFYTVDVINTLNDMNQLFIMPAVRKDWVVDAIEAYANGTGKRVFQHTIRGKTGQAPVTVMIVPKNGAKDTDPPKDRYVAFITNASMQKALTLLANVSVIYRNRWDIETGYRVAKKMRPFTCSRNPSVRLVLFYFSMILYNLWKISCWLAGGSDDTGEARVQSLMTSGDTGDVYVRPPITTDRMVNALYSACVRMIKKEIISEAFFSEIVT